MEVCNSGISGNENHVENKKDESKSALLVQDAEDKLHRQPTSTSQIPAEEIERLRKMGEDLCRAVEEIAEPKPLDPEVVKRYINEQDRRRFRRRTPFWNHLFHCCCCHGEDSAL